MDKKKLSHSLTEKNIGEFRNMFKGKHFELSIHEIFLYPKKFSTIYPLIKRKFGIGAEDIDNLHKYATILDQRLRNLFNHASHRNCPIMIDAEQTYLQVFIDYLVAYYFRIYNTDSCLLSTTLQCYLKNERQNLKKWRMFCDENNLKFGLKLVRGAYITEESQLAKRNRRESPVCENIECTNENYNESIKFLFNTYKEGDKVYIH
jgi:hypothetical protein